MLSEIHLWKYFENDNLILHNLRFHLVNHLFDRIYLKSRDRFHCPKMLRKLINLNFRIRVGLEETYLIFATTVEFIVKIYRR